MARWSKSQSFIYIYKSKKKRMILARLRCSCRTRELCPCLWRMISQYQVQHSDQLLRGGARPMLCPCLWVRSSRQLFMMPLKYVRRLLIFRLLVLLPCRFCVTIEVLGRPRLYVKSSRKSALLRASWRYIYIEYQIANQASLLRRPEGWKVGVSMNIVLSAESWKFRSNRCYLHSH